MLTYEGNVPYCYANAVSMLLSSAGETVAPSEIEPLTGMGFGAQARLLGRAHTEAARRDYPALAATLRTLAATEEEFEANLGR